MYSGCGIAFDGGGELSVGNDYARNVVTFGLDNSSSIIQGDTFRINGRFGASEKKIVLILVKLTIVVLLFHLNFV